MSNLISRHCTENVDFKYKKGNEVLKILNYASDSNYTLITYTSVSVKYLLHDIIAVFLVAKLARVNPNNTESLWDILF